MNPDRHMPPSTESLLDIRTKLAIFSTFLIPSFMFNHPLGHLGLGMLVLAAARISGQPLRQLMSILIPVLPLLILIVLFTGFNGNQTFRDPLNQAPIFEPGAGLVLTRGGLLLGLTLLLRLINMIAASRILMAIAPLDDLIQLFHKMRLPHSLSFVITTAIRFIPELEKKRRLIMNAQQARGASLDDKGMVTRFRMRIAIMVPLIVNAIIMADRLSMAMLNRGFGYRNTWTNLHEIRLKKNDIVILLICLMTIICAVFIRTTTQWALL
ncbi:MAG: energy-coupling factor transporter transmembrane protein EcfT [Desulfobacteraceae bacterium]|nr:energy-coupling factor transporter transmembrane protein EcfT [Desulfobacteraceae bacterium]